MINSSNYDKEQNPGQTERKHEMYNHLDETQSFPVADGFVSFMRTFWYLGLLISYNLLGFYGKTTLFWFSEVGNEQLQVLERPREADKAISYQEALRLIYVIVNFMLVFCLPQALLLVVGRGVDHALSIKMICC